jgi:drug/metabolite transporter (DMT)-like permease
VRAIELALAAAVSWGIADFLGGVASRRTTTLIVTPVSLAAGVPILLAIVLSQHAQPSVGALVWSILGGVGVGLALATFFYAMARGLMAVITPVSAVAAAALPVAAGLALGERPSGLAWAGVALIFPAVALMGWTKNVFGNSDESRAAWAGQIRLSFQTRSKRERLIKSRLLTSMSLALAAGAGFGLFRICMSLAPHDSGVWPAVISQAVSLLTVTLAAITFGVKWQASTGSLRLSIASGIVSSLASVFYLFSVREGQLALVSVLAALYPTVTVALSLILLRERVRPPQVLGIILAFAALGLISSGRPGQG